MAVTPRILVSNLVKATATTLTASSALSTAPVTYLLDQARTKCWRTASNAWVVVAGFNNAIDFNRGGVKTTTIGAGTYTSTTYAAAVVAAMDDVDGGQNWVCTYSSTTHKFTISGDNAFVLLCNTGTNAATAAWVDLGYSTAADTGSATSHVGDYAVYQSRHWIKCNLGSALAVRSAVALDHNLSANGTITIQGNATDAWDGPTVSEVLTENSDGDLAVKHLSADQTLQYWRLLINDCRNSDGYSELGVAFIGPATIPTKAYQIGRSQNLGSLNQITQLPSGAVWVNEEPDQSQWTLTFGPVGDTQRGVIVDAFNTAAPGTFFFFAFDATGAPTNTRYVYRVEPIAEENPSGAVYTVGVTLVEAVA